MWRGWFGEEPVPSAKQRIESLVAMLHEMGLDPTAEELGDALWLAMQVRPFAERKRGTSDTEPGEVPTLPVSREDMAHKTRPREGLNREGLNQEGLNQEGLRKTTSKKASPLYPRREGKAASLRGGYPSPENPGRSHAPGCPES